jgi:hypothetical protein
MWGSEESILRECRWMDRTMILPQHHKPIARSTVMTPRERQRWMAWRIGMVGIVTRDSMETLVVVKC